MKEGKRKYEKTVLITGSTGGIGLAFSEKFAKENYNLLLVSRNEDRLNKQKEYLKGYNVTVKTIAQDLKELDAAEKVYKSICDLGIKVDILINNAGFNECGNFLETDIENEVSMIQLHCIFLTRLTKLLIPSMVERKSGKIINLGSTGAYISCPLDAVYAATKAYVLSFSNGLKGELRGTGVTVTTVCPGATKTEFAKKANIENTMLFKMFVMKPEKVVNKVYGKIIRGRRVVVPGIYNKILIVSSKIIPSYILDNVSLKMLQR